MTLGATENGETTVEVEITEADVIEFRLYHLSHSRIVRRTVWISVSVILLAWAGVVIPMVFDSPNPREAASSLWPLLGFPVLFLVIFFSLQKRRLKRWSRKVLREGRNRTMFGRMSITLSNEGVREVGEFSNTFVQWAAVEKIVVTASSIYIYVSTASAVIVPKRCLQSDAQFEHFAAAAQERVSRR